ncbi:MAG: hypothetical protein AAFQ89_03730, partial [Cyanobacteria bacterium J06626_18]
SYCFSGYETGPPPPPLSERRGLDSYEEAFYYLLLNVDAQAALILLEEEYGAVCYREGIYGETITVPDEPLVAVIQLKGHSWTIISLINIPFSKKAFKGFYSGNIDKVEHIVKEISEISQTKVAYFRGIEPDYGIQFIFYDSGNLKGKILFSHFFVRGREGQRVDSELINYLLENDDDYILDSYFRYVFPEDGIDKVEVRYDYWEVTDKFMKENDAYVPCITWYVPRDQTTAKVSIRGLDYEDFLHFRLVRLREAN